MAIDAESNGNNEFAIELANMVMGRQNGQTSAVELLNRQARRIFADAISTRDSGHEDKAIDLLVRSMNLNPLSGEVVAELKRMTDQKNQTDLTKRCYIFPDAARAEKWYRDAIQTTVDFVTYSGIEGDVYEFGVLGGWTARIFAETLVASRNPARLHLFDSFAGLPREKDGVDLASYDVKRGVWEQEMNLSEYVKSEIDTTLELHIKDRLARTLHKDRIFMNKGFFSDSLCQKLEHKAAIVHLDCDLYQSTVEVLDALRRDDILQDGTVLLFDDWNCNRANPAFGQRRAFAEFLETNKASYSATNWFHYGFNSSAWILHDAKLAMPN